MTSALPRAFAREPAAKRPALDRRSTDAEVAVDLAAIVLTSIAIGAAADQLVFMSALVPAIILARMVAWTRFGSPGRRGLRAELSFFAVCTLLGGFNDWNSVVRHRIYDYDVPVFLPAVSTIPFWMLLFWGMILRFLLSLSLWHRTGAPATAPTELRLGRRRFALESWQKVSVLLVLVLVTRQAIYRTYADPIWSWLPFLLAGLVYVALFGLRKDDLRLCAFMAIAGPAIEVVYIQVGGLHHYQLGWLGGVPVWIALWWLVAVLVWKDVGGRLLGVLRRRL